MEIIKRAANGGGDYVVFRKIRTEITIYHNVRIYNTKTRCFLDAFHHRIPVSALGRKYLEKAARIEGEAIFEEACDFMGIEPEEEEGGKTNG